LGGGGGQIGPNIFHLLEYDKAMTPKKDLEIILVSKKKVRVISVFKK